LAVSPLRKWKHEAYIHYETEGKPQEMPVSPGILNQQPSYLPFLLPHHSTARLNTKLRGKQICCFIELSLGIAADFAFPHGSLSLIKITLLRAASSL